MRECVALAHEAARLAAANTARVGQPQSHSDETDGLRWGRTTGARHSDDGHARDERTREESDDDETKLCRGFRLSPRYDDDGDDDGDDARDGLGN